MSVIDIKPIQLMYGSCDNTAQTGQGCFMNVVAYLNGDTTMSDHSPCVDAMVRDVAIHLNDSSMYEERQRLLPFVLRAMGSATNDAHVLQQRTQALMRYAERVMQAIAPVVRTLEKLERVFRGPGMIGVVEEQFLRRLRHKEIAGCFKGAQHAYAEGETHRLAKACIHFVCVCAELGMQVEYMENMFKTFSEGYSVWDTHKRSLPELVECEQRIFEAGLQFLDEALPPAPDELDLPVLQRAQELVDKNTKVTA